MTITFVAWSAVALRVALTGVRLMRPRRRPTPLPLLPARHPAKDRPDAEAWRPRVTSGCGR